MKAILIKNCLVCPNRSHRGGFATVSWIPCCSLMKSKELPYTLSGNASCVSASPTGEIPEWCPLPDFTEPQK